MYEFRSAIKVINFLHVLIVLRTGSTYSACKCVVLELSLVSITLTHKVRRTI